MLALAKKIQHLVDIIVAKSPSQNDVINFRGQDLIFNFSTLSQFDTNSNTRQK